MALNVDNKESVLDDNAALYQKDSDRNEKKTYLGRFFSLHGEERKQFFFDYMIKPLIVIVIAIAFFIYLVVSTIVNRRSYVFEVATYNPYYLDAEKVQGRIDDLAKKQNWEVDKHNVAVFSDKLSLSISNTGTNRGTMETYLEAGSLDVVFCTEEYLQVIAPYFVDLGNIEPELASLIPEGALKEITFERLTDNGNYEIQKKYIAIYVKDTVFADCIKDPDLKDTLLVAFPYSGNAKKDKYRGDFFKYLFEK